MTAAVIYANLSFMRIADLPEHDPRRLLAWREGEIFRRFVQGASELELANAYNLSQKQVLEICRRWSEANPSFDLSGRLFPKKSGRRYSSDDLAIRADDIVTQRSDGVTFREIGEKYDISRETARQIYAKEMRRRRKKGIA